jgi:hypothetical protein
MTAAGPDYDLQKAVVALLTANADIQSLLGTAPRIYEEVPTPPVTFPYIVVGSGQVLDASVEDSTQIDVIVTINVWSKAPGFAEAKQIAAVIKVALHERQASLALQECSCSAMRFQSAHDQRDPDGISKQIIMSFKAHVTPNS